MSMPPSRRAASTIARPVLGRCPRRPARRRRRAPTPPSRLPSPLASTTTTVAPSAASLPAAGQADPRGPARHDGDLALKRSHPILLDAARASTTRRRADANGGRFERVEQACADRAGPRRGNLARPRRYAERRGARGAPPDPPTARTAVKPIPVAFHLGPTAHRDPHLRHRAGGDVLVRLPVLRATAAVQRLPDRVVHRRVPVDRGRLDRRRPPAARAGEPLDLHRRPRRDHPGVARRPVVVRRAVVRRPHRRDPGPPSLSRSSPSCAPWTSWPPCSWRRGVSGACSVPSSWWRAAGIPPTSGSACTTPARSASACRCPILQAIDSFIIFGVLLLIERYYRDRPVGFVLAATMALWGLTRFYEERLWLGEIGHLGSVLVQVAGLALFAAGLVVMVLLYRRHRAGASPPGAATDAAPPDEVVDRCRREQRPGGPFDLTRSSRGAVRRRLGALRRPSRPGRPGEGLGDREPLRGRRRRPRSTPCRPR